MPHELPAHTSASQLACYARCPRQYRYRYVEGREAESKNPALAVGTAVHGAVAWWFESRKVGHEPDHAAALRILRADLGAALASPDYRVDGNEAATLLAEAEKLLALFLAHLDDLEVVTVEERFELHLLHPDTGEPLPRPLVGFLDLVLADGTIVELKTAARAYGTNELVTNLQFAAYRYVAREHERPDVRLVSLVKTKAPKVQEVSLRPATSMSAEWFVRVVAEVEAAIAAGVFPPTPGMSCATCDYRAPCFGLGVDAAA